MTEGASVVGEDAAKLYEGKAKIVYTTANPGELRLHFKDDLTAFNGQKHDQMAGKGYYNAQITAILLSYLQSRGIPTHFIRLLGDTDLLVRKLAMVPLEVVVRNIAAGSLAKRLGLEEGSVLSQPVIELYYKNDTLGDPMVNRTHVRAMGWAKDTVVDRMIELARQANTLLQEYFSARGLVLVDFKLEFGLVGDEVVLGDEITPDTCRLWDAGTQEKLDKDRFRRDLGGVMEAYQEVYRRLTTRK